MLATGIAGAIVLNRMISNKKKEINEIRLNIERFTQGVAKAREASEHYRNAISNMNSIISQVSTAFKGQAADEFTNRLISYRDYCQSRANQMDALIDDYNQRIIMYDAAKRRGEQALNTLNSTLKAVILLALL